MYIFHKYKIINRSSVLQGLKSQVYIILLIIHNLYAYPIMLYTSNAYNCICKLFLNWKKIRVNNLVAKKEISDTCIKEVEVIN